MTNNEAAQHHLNWLLDRNLITIQEWQDRSAALIRESFDGPRESLLPIWALAAVAGLGLIVVGACLLGGW